MRLRRYDPSRDFESIRRWFSDGRTHALWCADLIPYPLERESFEAALMDAAARFGDTPFVAVDDGDAPLGFFCYSLNPETNIGKLKFVVVDEALRGRGLGGEMLALAKQYAFETTKADALQLGVFTVNDRAMRCYRRAGFVDQDLTENAFCHQGKSWDRLGMIVWRGDGAIG